MYFWGSDFETLCEQNCRQYRVYADIYPKNEDGGYDETPSITYTATRGSSSAGAVSFETAAIVSVKIVKGMTSGAFSYGGAFGGQLTLVTTADTKIPANDTKIVISVSFVSDEGQETGKAMLGTFFSESVASGQFTKTIKATDGVSKLNKYYVPDPAEFPMTAMDLFKKAAVVAGVDPSLYETDFKLNNPNITEAPLKKKGGSESEEDSAEDEYYTYREIAGMIASVNAGNAFISALNHLNISTPDVGLKREIPIKSVISYTDNEIVNKFSTTFWAQTYTGEGTPPIIDPLSEEYDPSVMVVDFPLSTDDDYAEMQENIDGQIGGISYNGIVIKKQGTGRQEIGDLLAFNDTYRNKKFDNVLVMGIVYDISAQGGFVETLYSLSHSEAKQQAKGISTNTRVDRLESKVESSGGGEVVSGGVGEFTNEEKNSEIFNSYKDVSDDNGTVTAKKNYINPSTAFAHVSGASNAIDEDESITSFSNMAAAVGGQNNKILNGSLFSFVGGGQENKIEKSIMSAIISGINNEVFNSQFATILGGSNNKVKNSYFSCILGCLGGTVQSSQSFIGGGIGNSIDNRNGSGSVILGGTTNNVKVSYSAIICSTNSSIEGESCYNSAIICGNANTVTRNYAATIGGSSNKINSECSVSLGGADNSIDNLSSRCAVSGINNEIENSRDSFVCGIQNKCAAGYGCFVCGSYADARSDHRLVVGGGSYDERKNVFYVRYDGAVFAKSFNIIGETASEASTFSARSADNPDLSELTAQISEIKAEIEALRVENQTLRAEIESLKANL